MGGPGRWDRDLINREERVGRDLVRAGHKRIRGLLTWVEEEGMVQAHSNTSGREGLDSTIGVENDESDCRRRSHCSSLPILETKYPSQALFKTPLPPLLSKSTPPSN
jgi:hypothetical protein